MTATATPIQAVPSESAAPPSTEGGRRTSVAATLVATSLGAMLTFLQITATVTSLSTIQAELGVDAVTLVWIPSAYTLMVASLVLSASALGSRFGHRRLFLLGVAVMIAGAAINAFAGAAVVVIVGQLVAGIGGALVLPNSLALLSARFADPHRRTEAITAWVAASGLGLAIGPVLAGGLLLVADWHTVYASTIVLGLVTAAITWARVGEQRRPATPVDVAGLVLATLVVGGVVFALIEGGRSGYGSATALSAFAVAAIALAVFIPLELRSTHPMLDLRLFASASFGAVMLVGAVSVFGFTGVSILLVLRMQEAQGLDPLATGLRMLVFFGTYVVVAALAGPLVRRTGFKAPLTVGLALGAITALALAVQPSGVPFAIEWPLFAVFGLSLGLAAAPATAAALASVAPSAAGMAAGAVNAARQLGAVLAPSVLGTVLTSTMLASLPARLAQHGVTGDAAGAARADVAAGRAAGLTGGARLAYAQALEAGVHVGLLVTAIVFAVTAIIALALVRNRPHVAA